MANKPGYEENTVLAFGCQALGRSDRSGWIPRPHLDKLGAYEEEKLSKELKGLKIRFERPDGNKRDYRANGLGPPSSRTGTVKTDTGQYSVQSYFKESYRYKVEHPHLPTLHVGNLQRNIFLPMELCK